MNDTIKFKIGEETSPIIETNLKDSIFSELYRKAFGEINNYIEEIEKPESSTEKSKDLGNKEPRNNIFAFIGERGAGKTSCMLSVANALSEKDNGYNEIARICDSFESIKKTTFIDEMLIDPSFFDKKHNILSLIIANLFKRFKEKASGDNCNTNQDGKRKLIECFERVQDNLKNLLDNDKPSNVDSLESLVTFSAAIDLQKNIKELISSYLKFVKEGAKYLIIMIDDIDLHTEYAREMVEQIRKYFIQPNVIVLMAIKVDQLGNVIKNDLCKEYEKLLNASQMEYDTINEMVDRYLGKLLPHNHRIYLPDASVYFFKKLQIIDNAKEKEPNEDNLFTVRETVLSLIFDRTRYLFYNTIDTTSYIIPRNLRELRQLVALLYKMDTYRNDEKESKPDDNEMWLKAREYNQTLFLNYFKETWCDNSLSNQGKKDINELFKISDPLLINKSAVKLLWSYFNLSLPEDKEINLIVKPENKTYNISLGDVVYLIDRISKMTSIQKDLKYLFALKTFYSLKLYECYNARDMKINELKAVTNNLNDFSVLEKLISGSYINSEMLKLISSKRLVDNTLESRNNITVNIEVLNKDNDSIDNSDTVAKEMFMTLISRRPDTRNNDTNFRSEDEIRFNTYLGNNLQKNAIFDIVAPLYNLLDIKKCYSRFKDGDKLFKRSLENESSFIGLLIKQLKEDKSYTTDIVKDFEIIRNILTTPKIEKSSLTEIVKIIKRVSDLDVIQFNDKITTIINNSSTDIIGEEETKNLKDLLRELLEKIYNNIVPLIRSWVTIRNIEVLDSFIAYLVDQRLRKSGRIGEDKTYVDMFRFMSKFYIETYNIKNIKDRNKIDFGFFKLYESILGRENCRILYEEIFKEDDLNVELKTTKDEIKKLKEKIRNRNTSIKLREDNNKKFLKEIEDNISDTKFDSTKNKKQIEKNEKEVEKYITEINELEKDLDLKEKRKSEIENIIQSKKN